MLDSSTSLPALCSSSASPGLNVATQQSAVIVLTSAAYGSEKLLGAVLAGDAATVREMIKENLSLDITSEPLGNWLLVLLAVCSWQLAFADAFHPLLFTLSSSPSPLHPLLFILQMPFGMVVCCRVSVLAYRCQERACQRDHLADGPWVLQGYS